MSARSIASEQWGDYGDILQHGMTMHLPRVDGKLSLKRTGPYIPPVTLPGLGDMVLTDAARSLLEDSGLKGFSFLPVEKTLIVDLPWHAWDRTAGEPAEYPDSGEPEDYVLSKAHNSEMARAMGELWEVVVPFNVVVMRPHEIVESYKDLHIDLRTWDGADLLRSKEYGGILCSQRAKNWFVEQWNPYLRFDQFPAI